MAIQEPRSFGGHVYHSAAFSNAARLFILQAPLNLFFFRICVFLGLLQVMSDSAPGGGSIRFSALESDADHSLDEKLSPVRSVPKFEQDPGVKCMSSIRALRWSVAGLSVLSLVLIIALGAVASRSTSGSTTPIVPNPNPDPPNTLPGAVSVANIMSTLADLQLVAAAHNGSRCVGCFNCTTTVFSTAFSFACLDP